MLGVKVCSKGILGIRLFSLIKRGSFGKCERETVADLISIPEECFFFIKSVAKWCVCACVYMHSIKKEDMIMADKI